MNIPPPPPPRMTGRLICESCDHGYAPSAPACPWCGCSTDLSHNTHDDSCVDTECYRDYWLCRFTTGEVFQMFPGYPLDADGLSQALSKYRIVTFNGIKYDMPIIALALAGHTNEQLKQASDMLIVDQVRHWDLLRQFNVRPLDWVDHIDLFEVAPGEGSLKAYGGKMHSRKLQDLPIEPSASIGVFDRVDLRSYCGNDIETTMDLFKTFPAQIRLREQMGEEYGLDLRSKSDAQIAEAVMKSLLPFKVQVPAFAAGTEFNYRPPAWMAFTTPILQNVLKRTVGLPYSINPKGGVSPHHDNHLVDWGKDQVRLDRHCAYISKPKDWQHELVRVGGTSYAMGIGGLHSTESCVMFEADETYSLDSPDVASYYPSLIIETAIFPQQIGPTFSEIYKGWYDRRMVAKHSGDKKTANSLKTLLNGSFGKLNSKYSIFYAPTEMLQVTVTGQLALLMLIEALENTGISVVSANTDGLVVRCRRDMEWIRDDIIRWWESTTGFVMEMTRFSKLACRDVNSYVAITTDGDVKCKGAFAPPEPGPSGWPNPTGQVCVDAVVAYLQNGTPLADTIHACNDVRKFVYVRSVTGGGMFNPEPVLPKSTTLTKMREVAGNIADKAELLAQYDAIRLQRLARGTYLGKVVRWYYATGSKACITYKTGNLVPTTDGCAPLMELPDTLPDDIDYAWYEAEAAGLLVDIGATT